MPEDVWKGMCKMVHEDLPDCECYISTPDMGYAENENSRMFRWLRDSYGYNICAVKDLIDHSPADVIKFTVYHPLPVRKNVHRFSFRHGRTNPSLRPLAGNG